MLPRLDPACSGGGRPHNSHEDGLGAQATLRDGSGDCQSAALRTADGVIEVQRPILG
jgi:hypothetical protein